MSRLAIASGLLLAASACASAPPPRAAPATPRAEPVASPAVSSEAALARRIDDSLPADAWTPPISGGSLLVTRDGHRIVAADPDRDRVWILAVHDRGEPEVSGFVALRGGDEPGRVAEGADGAVFVALRRGGAVVKVDLARRAIVGRYATCAGPRGLHAEDDALHVACAEGELVTLSAATGEVRDRRFVAPDLRDVGRSATGLWVSSFRRAEWRHVEESGPPLRPPPVELPAPGANLETGPVGDYAATVAWRTFADEDGVTMVHQRAWTGDLTDDLIGSAAYYGFGAVQVGVSRWEDGALRWTRTRNGVLPVDATLTGDGRVALALAGSDRVLVVGPRRTRDLALHVGAAHRQPVAVAFHPRVGLVSQVRDGPGIIVYREHAERFSRGSTVTLGDYIFYRRPRGDQLFHRPGLGIACASCHPEGGDDGHVWRLEAQPRRTQSLRGGVLSKGAFHWRGELPTFGALINNTWVRRMGGQPLDRMVVQEVGQWLDRLPESPASPVSDPEAVARGRALFEDARVGCASCHAGPRLSDGRLHDVGTGDAYMTPALIGLAQRGPYLHDGCAQTLEERLGRCHTRGHGRVRHLDAAQRADLVAYMASL